MDANLFEIINSLAGYNHWTDILFSFSSVWLGYILIFVLALIFLSDRKKYLSMAILSLISAGLARFVFVTIIRLIYDRPRPFMILGDVNQLISHEESASFPSGHASFFFALAVVVFLFNKKWGTIFIFSAAIIGFSRIVAGIHWPSDILAGAILGTLTAIITYWGYKKLPVGSNSSDLRLR